MNLRHSDDAFYFTRSFQQKVFIQLCHDVPWLAMLSVKGVFSFQKYYNMKKCGSWDSWDVAASTLIKKLGKAWKWLWTWTSELEEIFVKEVRSNLGTEGWTRVCEESGKKNSWQRLLFRIFSSSFEIGGLETNSELYLF